MSKKMQEVYGNIPTTIRGKDFTVAWRTRKHYKGREEIIAYDLRTSYSYTEDGEEKTKYFYAIQIDKYEAFKDLKRQVESFLDQ